MTLVCQSISTIPLNALLVQGSTANHPAFQPAQLLQCCQVNSHNSPWSVALVDTTHATATLQSLFRQKIILH